MNVKKLRLNKKTLANLAQMTNDEKNGIRGGGSFTNQWDYLCNSYQNCQETQHATCDGNETWDCHSGHCVC